MRVPRLLTIAALCMACGKSDPPTTGAGPVPSGSGSGSAATPAALAPDPGSATQGAAPPSAKDALERLCDAEARSGAATAAPADRARVVAAWLREQVTNPEIVALVASLGTMSRADGQRLVAEAVRRHGIASCAFVAAAPLPFELPEVPSGGEADDDAGPLLIVSPTAVVLDGTAIAPLSAGALEASAVERGAIPRLTRLVQALRPAERVRIACASATPVATLSAVLASLTQAGVTQLALVGRSGDVRMLVPVAVARDGSPATELIVSLGEDRLLRLWSASGAHGTAAKPAVEVTLDGGLGQLARGLATARGALGTSGEPPAVTVAVDDRHDVATLVQVVATVRTMFPRVYLSRPLARGSR